MNILELSEQEIVRRNNLQQMRDLGIDPYPAAEYQTNAFSTEIKESFVDLPKMKNEEGDKKTAKRGARKGTGRKAATKKATTKAEAES